MSLTPSYADFYDLERQGHSFAEMSVFEQAAFNLAWGGSVERVGAARVDENFFTTLRSAPEIGRTIGAEDNQPGHDRVAVISHSLWQSMFADNADILERSLLLKGVRYRIVGVMPPAFEYPFSSDLPYGNLIKATHIWIPLALTSKQKAEREPGNDVAIARLRPGVSISQAQSEMSTIMVRLDQLHTGDMRERMGCVGQKFHGQRRRAGASSNAAAVRGGVAGAVDCLRKCSEPASSEGCQPDAGAGHAGSSRSGPRAHHPPTAH